MPKTRMASLGSTSSSIRMKSMAAGERGGVGSRLRGRATSFMSRAGWWKRNRRFPRTRITVRMISSMVRISGPPSSKTLPVASALWTAGRRHGRQVEDRQRLYPALPAADDGDHRQVADEGHELVQAPVLRAIDPGGTEDDMLHPAQTDPFLRHRLGLG